MVIRTEKSELKRVLKKLAGLSPVQYLMLSNNGLHENKYWESRPNIMEKQPKKSSVLNDNCSEIK